MGVKREVPMCPVNHVPVRLLVPVLPVTLVPVFPVTLVPVTLRVK